jgi:hypothetical protein
MAGVAHAPVEIPNPPPAAQLQNPLRKTVNFIVPAPSWRVWRVWRQKQIHTHAPTAKKSIR